MRIVICGSMAFFSQMVKINCLFHSEEIPSLIPADDEKLVFKFNKTQLDDYKRKASFQYLKEIRNPSTWSILVINFTKYSIKDYIGPNTFAEIAVAFANRKKIYLLYGMPEIYEEELNAWRVKPLEGKLDIIVKDYKTFCKRKVNKQLYLFED